MSRHPVLARIRTWFHGTTFGASSGGDEPEESARDAEERVEFCRRQEQVRARLHRLETLIDVRTKRRRKDDG